MEKVETLYAAYTLIITLYQGPSLLKDMKL